MQTKVTIWTNILCGYCAKVEKAPKGSHFCSATCEEAEQSRRALAPEAFEDAIAGEHVTLVIEKEDVRPGEVFTHKGAQWVATQHVTSGPGTSVMVARVLDSA